MVFWLILFKMALVVVEAAAAAAAAAALLDFGVADDKSVKELLSSISAETLSPDEMPLRVEAVL